MAENGRRERNNVLAMIALCVIVALIAGSVIVMQGMRRSTTMQDCVASGRTDCAPVDSGQR